MDPTLLATGGLLAAIFGLLALTDSDDDDRAAPEPEPEPEPQPELSEDGLTLTGTDRGDELDLGAFPDDVATILGGSGDDTITSEDTVYSDIHGEEGDDVIIIDSAYGALLDGGSGDDLIQIDQMHSSNQINGGDGSDTITLVDQASEMPNRIDAGAGDDILNITAQKAIFPMDFGDARVTLGEGQDTLNLSLDLRLMDNVEENDASLLLMNVQDFDPAEDQLNIFVDQDDRAFVDHVITERDGDTIVTFNYLMQNNLGEIPSSATVILSGVQGMSPDAIQLIRGAA